MSGIPNVLVKVHKGLYRILSVQCDCGRFGMVAEHDERRRDQWAWELYCSECLDCDPNGYATLRECAEVALKGKAKS